nr:8444_t:CDS:2 [Entrophospora candida]CAG8622550.1 8636_t:CDS:2 [Entrophospora candida]
MSSSSFKDHNQLQFVNETINSAEDRPKFITHVKVPYPPPIKPEELVIPKKNGEVPSRSPNPFIIYRRLYHRELKAKNLTLKMTDVSSMASTSWKKEPKSIKDAYFQIAEKARNMLTDTRQKSLTFSRRKRKPNLSSISNNHNRFVNSNNQKRSTTYSPTLIKSSYKKQKSSSDLVQSLKDFENCFGITTANSDNISQTQQTMSSPSYSFSLVNKLMLSESIGNIYEQYSIPDLLGYSDGENSSPSTDGGNFDKFNQQAQIIMSPTADTLNNDFDNIYINNNTSSNITTQAKGYLLHLKPFLSRLIHFVVDGEDTNQVENTIDLNEGPLR